jgi:hypothetical protein
VNLQDEELKHIIANTEQKNVLISDEINDLLRETYNSCVLTIKNKNITKKDLTCYGICRYESCKQFKLVVEKKTNDACAHFTVLSNSLDYNYCGYLKKSLIPKQILAKPEL